MNAKIPFSSDPKTLKRQPTNSWQPLTAIGASRKQMGESGIMDTGKMAMMKQGNLGATGGAIVGGLVGATTNFKPRKDHKFSDSLVGTGMSNKRRAAQGAVGAGLGAVLGAGLSHLKLAKVCLEKTALSPKLLAQAAVKATSKGVSYGMKSSNYAATSRPLEAFVARKLSDKKLMQAEKFMKAIKK